MMKREEQCVRDLLLNLVVVGLTANHFQLHLASRPMRNQNREQLEKGPIFRHFSDPCVCEVGLLVDLEALFSTRYSSVTAGPG